MESEPPPPPPQQITIQQRIRTKVVTDVALSLSLRAGHVETISHYRFLLRALPCSFILSFPLLFEWFGFYRSLVKASFNPLPSRRQRALFKKEPDLAVVLMPFRAICTFVASFSAPFPALIPPRNPFPSSLRFHYGSCIDRAGYLSFFLETIVFCALC